MRLKSKAEYSLDMLIEEANTLRRYAGKPFLSVKDIENAWYSVKDIYPKDVFNFAMKLHKKCGGCKIKLKPKMGLSKIDKIIEKHIPQERTDIKIKSMNWSVSKKVRHLIYRIAKQMENY